MAKENLVFFTEIAKKTKGRSSVYNLPDMMKIILKSCIAVTQKYLRKSKSRRSLSLYTSFPINENKQFLIEHYRLSCYISPIYPIVF